jgi:hypothetical protein
LCWSISNFLYFKSCLPFTIPISFDTLKSKNSTKKFSFYLSFCASRLAHVVLSLFYNILNKSVSLIISKIIKELFRTLFSIIFTDMRRTKIVHIRVLSRWRSWTFSSNYLEFIISIFAHPLLIINIMFAWTNIFFPCFWFYRFSLWSIAISWYPVARKNNMKINISQTEI